MRCLSRAPEEVARVTLLDVRLEYESIKSSWRSRPPSQHNGDLRRLRELKEELDSSADEGTEQLSTEIDDLIAQVAHQGVRMAHPSYSSTYIEPSDAM
jgi:hypothetical protein